MENNTVIEEKDELREEVKKLLKKGHRKGRRKLILVLSLCLVVLLFLAVSWISGSISGKRKSEEEIIQLKNLVLEQDEQIQVLRDTPIVVNPVAPEIILDLVYSEIKEIGQLVTAEYIFTDAAKFSDSRQIKNWSIPLTEKYFFLKWDGRIKAGIDLSGLVFEANREEFKLTVYIPQAQIISYEVDNDSVEILVERDNIFNKITLDDKIKFDSATEEAMINRAIENGILQIAQTNAAGSLEKLLTGLNSIDSSYNFEFVPLE